MSQQLRTSPARLLWKAVNMIEAQGADVGRFLIEDAKGQKMLQFLKLCADELAQRDSEFVSELTATQERVDQIKRVIMTQQIVASTFGMVEEFDFSTIVGNALEHAAVLIEGGSIRVIEERRGDVWIVTDKNKVLQIAINLVKNACEALGESGVDSPTMAVRLIADETSLTFEVEDNGTGFPPSVRDKLFVHGFTTKKRGHGYGLHGCALYAKQLGGSLTAQSDGEGMGARFVLKLPRIIAQKSSHPPLPLRNSTL